VTWISSSSPRPGGENSAGTLPKFRKRDQETEEEKKEFLQKEMSDYLFRQWKVPLQGPFLFFESPPNQ
jgi:hypothetical protein